MIVPQYISTTTILGEHEQDIYIDERQQEGRDIVSLVICEIKRALFSTRSLVCMFAFAFILSINQICDAGQLASAIYHFDMSFSAGFYDLLFPCAAIPFSDSYLMDRSTGVDNLIIIRSRANTYCLGKIISTALSGFAVLVLGGWIYLSVLLTRYNLVLDPYSSYVGYECLLNEGRCVEYFFIRIVITGLIGSSFSVLTLFVSTYLDNRAGVLAMPIVIFYAINEIENLFSVPLFLNVTYIMHSPLWGESQIVLSCCYVVIFSVVIDIIFGVLFYKRVVAKGRK